MVKLGEMQGNRNPDRGRAAVFRDCASLSDFSSTLCRTASQNPASALLYTLCTAQIVVTHFSCTSYVFLKLFNYTVFLILKILSKVAQMLKKDMAGPAPGFTAQDFQQQLMYFTTAKH